MKKRGGEKRPFLSDLHESVSIKQDANCIVFFWCGEYYNITKSEDDTATADTVLFDIAKHRNGATDEVIAACHMRRGTFQDLTITASSSAQNTSSQTSRPFRAAPGIRYIIIAMLVYYGR